MKFTTFMAICLDLLCSSEGGREVVEGKLLGCRPLRSSIDMHDHLLTLLLSWTSLCPGL